MKSSQDTPNRSSLPRADTSAPKAGRRTAVHTPRTNRGNPERQPSASCSSPMRTRVTADPTPEPQHAPISGPSDRLPLVIMGSLLLQRRNFHDHDGLSRLSVALLGDLSGL